MINLQKNLNYSSIELLEEMLSRDTYGAGNTHILNPKFHTKFIKYSLNKNIFLFLIFRHR